MARGPLHVRRRPRKGPKGQIGAGLARPCPTGTTTLIPPTLDISATGEELTLDGVRMVFQVTPGTEAPAEMNFFFPDHRRCARRRTPLTPCTTS